MDVKESHERQSGEYLPPPFATSTDESGPTTIEDDRAYKIDRWDTFIRGGEEGVTQEVEV